MNEFDFVNVVVGFHGMSRMSDDQDRFSDVSGDRSRRGGTSIARDDDDDDDDRARELAKCAVGVEAKMREMGYVYFNWPGKLVIRQVAIRAGSFGLAS